MVASRIPRALSYLLLCTCPVWAAGCSGDDSGATTSNFTTATTETSGDGDGDAGDGDGDMGDGDGDGDGDAGDGDGDDCTDQISVVELRELFSTATGFADPLPEMDSVELTTTTASVGAGDRIYLYLDGDMAGQTLTTQFQFLVYTLNAQGCALNLAVDLGSLELVERPIVDVSETAMGDVTQVELGGDGVNVWEITELEPQDDDCGPTVLNSVGYTEMGGPYTVVWDYSGMDAVLRDVRIYSGDIALGCP